MIGSLFAGISGLNANATAMTVVGDNIANVNTTAFKSNRSSFANILSQSLGGSGGNDIGRGVDFWGTTPVWSQGSLENTSSPTDLAINGRGFFVLDDANGGRFYSRAGEFNFDRNGDLRNPDNLVVQGYPVTGVASDGTLALGSLSDLSVPG
ncbi:MAG: flagellar hook-basal body complex protein, partial [Desulfobacterales bacterium]